jgi:cytochrome b6-f complex iron-sulfur subunit
VTEGFDRRAFLRALAGSGALAGAAALDGCRARPPWLKPTQALVPLADVPVGGRLKVLVAGKPIELRRNSQGVAARSLLCTHTGCTVAWDEGRQRYLCPCHEGVYDANGVVLAGAPTAGLADVPAIIVVNDVVVGT